MRIDTWPDWAKLARATTQPSEKGWCGIAIAPGSDEGLVMCEDFPLQAGRVLPLRSNRYSIRRARPAGYQLEDDSLDCIKSLSLILFEDPAEMGAHANRPNANYFVRDWQTPELAIPALHVPFVGRDQAHFTLHSDDLGVATFTYDVVGVRYQYSLRGVARYTLHEGTLVNLDSNRSYSFYLDCEEWDALELIVREDSGATWNIDCDTIGEIGAR